MFFPHITFNNFLFTLFAPHIFTMQDNFDDLWMTHHVFLCVFFTNSGITFEERALGQLQHYITYPALSNMCSIQWRFLRTTSENCTRCEAGMSGTGFWYPLLTNHFDGDSLVYLHSQQLSWIIYKSISVACMHVALVKLSHFLHQIVRGQNPRCHG